MNRARVLPRRLAETGLACAWVLLATGGATLASDAPFAASGKALEIDGQIDWSRARLIAVQDGGRYKTLDSFARESMAEMYGKERLPGLSPAASLFEWLFNREAYLDAPVVRIRDMGVRIHLSAHMIEASRRRIQETGYMTPRELEDPSVAQRIEELEPQAPMITAMRRVRNAEGVARFLEQMFRIVPDPQGDAEAKWYSVGELQAKLPPELRGGLAAGAQAAGTAAIPGITAEQATTIMAAWAALWKGWREADAGRVQAALDRLTEYLPTLAREGVYPADSQRAAEARYYAWGKFTWGYWIYMLGLLAGVPAIITRWRRLWVASLALLLIALVVHGYGISLRWYILGRIPVANMFEALVGSAWIGIALALVVELRYRTGFLLVGAHATGFFALVLAGYVVPGGGTLTTIMGILDDVMLRIHTVLIISSYSLIFLAAVIAVVYLFGYYSHRSAGRSAEVGVIVAGLGCVLWILTGLVFQTSAMDASGIAKGESAAMGFGIAAIASLALLIMVVRPAASSRLVAALSAMLGVTTSLAIGNHGFCVGVALVMIAGGMLWAAGNGVVLVLRARGRVGEAAVSLAASGDSGGGAMLRMPMASQPVLAGAMPGDRLGAGLPAWLQQADWSHLIVLNMMFVMLFVGVILGAVWADYSWGRPWGWDPKEVFAMNTWIVYAILIHLRFVTKNKGLWTAWTSVIGCLMMAFNWCFVNFYIVGLHSYA